MAAPSAVQPAAPGPALRQASGQLCQQPTTHTWLKSRLLKGRAGLAPGLPWGLDVHRLIGGTSVASSYHLYWSARQACETFLEHVGIARSCADRTGPMRGTNKALPFQGLARRIVRPAGNRAGLAALLAGAPSTGLLVASAQQAEPASVLICVARLFRQACGSSVVLSLQRPEAGCTALYLTTRV